MKILFSGVIIVALCISESPIRAVAYFEEEAQFKSDNALQWNAFQIAGNRVLTDEEIIKAKTNVKKMLENYQKAWNLKDWKQLRILCSKNSQFSRYWEGDEAKRKALVDTLDREHQKMGYLKSWTIHASLPSEDPGVVLCSFEFEKVGKRDARMTFFLNPDLEVEIGNLYITEPEVK